MSRAIKLKWAATAAAGFYTALMLVLMWIIGAFPATPKLGPIYQNITHYVPLDFPLLLIVPAFAIDLTWRRVRDKPGWLASVALGTVFLVAFVIAQWPFADLLMRHGANWFFHIDNFVYWRPKQSEAFAYRFRPAQPGEPPAATLYALALVSAIVASAIGRAWGRWMTRVVR
jgi:hypothetical protein